MTETKFTLKFETGWSMFWAAVRVGMLVFVGFHAPWYVTVVAGLMQVRFDRRKT
jgi:hypothetical protein